VEQVIRPTGLLDPIVEVVPAQGQVMHLLEQIRERVKMGDRTLVTALTKRLAEDLANFFTDHDVKCRWLHSELDAFERVELLRELRDGRCEVLVGVNLLREGLDLPEVSLVAILDADKEGFLRSETSLIQTIGRAARNANSKVILYADTITSSMQIAIEETRRRRKRQEEYNALHGITPETVKKEIMASIHEAAESRKRARDLVRRDPAAEIITEAYLKSLEEEMLAAAENLEFERAAALRDKIMRSRERIGEPVEAPDEGNPRVVGAKQKKRSASGSGGKIPRRK
jgi:excinuclease ABC subunit B